MKKLIVCLALSTSLLGCGGSESNSTPTPTNPSQPSNPSPVVESPSVTITSATSFDERNAYVLTETFSDQTGAAATYHWQIAPSDSVVSMTIDNPAAASPTLTIGEVTETTTVELSITVTDSNGVTATDSVNVTLNELDEALLPPDPGAAGKQTLPGVDVNANGVRDDIEREIYYFNKASKSDRDVLMAAAYGYQKAILAGSSNNQNSNDTAAYRLYRGVACIHKFTNLDLMKTTALLRVMAMNTSERSDSYEAFGASQDGSVIDEQDPDRATCLIIGD